MFFFRLFANALIIDGASTEWVIFVPCHFAEVCPPNLFLRILLCTPPQKNIIRLFAVSPLCRRWCGVIAGEQIVAASGPDSSRNMSPKNVSPRLPAMKSPPSPRNVRGNLVNTFTHKQLQAYLNPGHRPIQGRAQLSTFMVEACDILTKLLLDS